MQPVLAPAYCESCYRGVSYGQVFCVDCTKLMLPVANLDLKINAKYTVPVLAIANYADPLKKLILAKNGGNRLASKQLAQLIWEQTSLRYLAVDYVIPVPLHWTRLVTRGFNQAAIIAENLVACKQVFDQERLAASLENRSAELPVRHSSQSDMRRDIAGKSVQVVHLLKRVKRTNYQAELKTVARWQNVQSAFNLNTELLNNHVFANKNLVLVDDLMTTGATVISIAKLLATLKPRSITVVVACRVVF